MDKFKHYSFDLWLTLIKSNLEFKRQRTIYFHKNFNGKNKSIPEIRSIFRKVDLMGNAINEKVGGNLDAEEQYLMVIYEMNGDNSLFSNINLKKLYEEMEALFFKYHPVLYSNETISCLEKLRQKKGITINLLSNTGFIKGVTLRKLLQKLELATYFDFQLYSDELQVSKPNIEIFNHLENALSNYCDNKKINRNEIIHIGDNPNSDIKGALNAGLRALQINSNNQTIQNLFT